MTSLPSKTALNHVQSVGEDFQLPLHTAPPLPLHPHGSLNAGYEEKRSQSELKD